MSGVANVSKDQLEDARRVLRVLTAAFPTYPVGDDTAELYLAVIANDLPDFAVAMRVVTDWATTQLLFPKPVELTEAYTHAIGRQRARSERIRDEQRRHRGDTYACPRCKDTGIQHVKEMNLDKLYDAIRPCEVCRPDDRDYQDGGHLEAGHDFHDCAHPRCEQRAEGRSRRGRR